MNSIRADQNQVWIPAVEVLNRIRDFSPGDEKKRQLKIDSGGNVRYVRTFRMRSSMSPSIENYPYDVQVAILTLASGDYSTHKLNLTTDTWTSLILNRTNHDLKSWLTSPKALNIILHYSSRIDLSEERSVLYNYFDSSHNNANNNGAIRTYIAE